MTCDARHSSAATVVDEYRGRGYARRSSSTGMVRIPSVLRA
ncbi:Uncharacterised protein [Nocardia africana]|uniref:Uncharacterized protein n=1 Tax=Nocardia africana TaxID=134964 RepID=A0A378WSH7_9NOCA|nr:Uncharacterised protein [Nocardia africana]